MGYLEHPQGEYPPGYYRGTIRVERDERYGVRVWPDMSTARLIQQAPQQETETMGRSNRDERITIEPPDTVQRRLHRLEEGQYFRCPKGEAVYQVLRRAGLGQGPRAYVACRMVGRPGIEGEYKYPPDKYVVQLHLTGIQFREADK